MKPLSLENPVVGIHRMETRQKRLSPSHFKWYDIHPSLPAEEWGPTEENELYLQAMHTSILDTFQHALGTLFQIFPILSRETQDGWPNSLNVDLATHFRFYAEGPTWLSSTPMYVI